MPRSRHQFVVLPIAVLLMATTFGCAAQQQLANRPPVQNSRTFDADYDAVWAAVVGTLADQGLPIQVVEKDSGIITTQQVQFASGVNADKQIGAIAYRPPAGGFLSVWNMGRHTLSVHVSRMTDATTVVKVTPHIEGYESNVTNSWHVCDSNGVLESRVLGAVSARLTAGP